MAEHRMTSFLIKELGVSLRPPSVAHSEDTVCNLSLLVRERGGMR